MNKEKDQRIYLKDILERIRRIEEAMLVGEAEFRLSTLHQDAMIRNFEVIGEIVKRLDTPLTALAPEGQWSLYARFRDLLIHKYDEVILDIVWETGLHDLQPLKEATTKLLHRLDTETPSTSEL